MWYYGRTFENRKNIGSKEQKSIKKDEYRKRHLENYNKKKG